MSDFLTNLAARGTNTLPMAQPRIAARFEPNGARPLMEPQQSPGIEIEEATERIAMPPRSPAPRRAAPPIAEREESAARTERPAERIPTTETPRENAIVQPVQTARPPTSSPAVLPMQTPESPEASLTLSEAEASSQPVRRSASMQPVVSPLHETDRHAAQAEFPAEQVGETNVVQNTKTVQESRLGEPALPERERETPRVMVVGPPIVPALAPQFSFAPEPELSSSPIIRVTIGRIDVRAVSAPAPAAPRPAPKPASAQSLDAYLHERNGGSR
jgi:hypothetical protein